MLWILDSETYVDFKNELLPIINNTLMNFKKVIITKRLLEREYTLLIEYKNDNLYIKPRLTDVGNILYDIQIPVIMITGICPTTDKSKIGIDLHEKLSEYGYKTALIGSRGDIVMLRHYYIDDQILDDSIPMKKRIRLANQMLHDIEQKMNPDIIILIIPRDYQIDIDISENNYGERLFLFSRACKPDYLIVSTMYDYHKYCMYESVDGYESIINICSQKIDAINICSRKLLIEESEILDAIECLTLKNIDREEMTTYNKKDMIITNGNMSVVADDIIEKLSCYSGAKKC
ncbi:MAG: hypothetical protein Q4A19_07235 [Johnsonella sp.]|nr:hypothetical protein [Johnsonella sp.]